MKLNFFKLCFYITVALLVINVQGVKIYAQKAFSITLNFKAFDINKNKIEGEDATKSFYDGESSFSGNFRLFNQSKFALRLGLGFDKLKYQIYNDSLNTNFDAVRENLTAYIGAEKHFPITFFTPYVGVYVPITFNSKDKIDKIIEDASKQANNGDIKAGFAVLAGINFKLLQFLRLGVEFNLGFDKFKSEVVNKFIDENKVNINSLDYGTEFTLGVAF